MIEWVDFNKEKPPENKYILCLEDSMRSIVFQGYYKHNLIFDVLETDRCISHWAYLNLPNES